jgi:hypothetical protein
LLLQGKIFILNAGGSIGTGDSMDEYMIKDSTKMIKIVPHIYENNKMTFLDNKGVNIDLSM